ncbi:BspA family leucine-rich repeat surface protein [Clostridium sp.]|uniref:BspA family leucine-rich repeat surface protein n=1 Tax=Clostridium sp. TaxID=1506 RepID=UPI0025BC9057|nr:BspA family leucine-rich repeat surface protein [Clostridium sp.]
MELNQMYVTLRSNGLFTLENMLSYFERVWEVIPPKMYNESQQIKYINDGAVGTVALHGNRKLQIKKWLRERIAYLDSKFGYYAGGGTNEQYVNFRMNYQGNVSLDISTYYTVYAKVRWASKNEQIIRIAKGQKKTFSYYSDVGTDREVMIMLPESLKTIENISNIHPNSIDISKATKLTQIEAHNPNLFSVDLSKNKYLRKVDFNGCTNLGTETATMTLNYCKYLNKVDLRGTQITAVTFNNKGGSLREIYYPSSIQSINLVNQSLLTDMVLPYGEDGSKAPIDLATINIENCPNISKLIDISSDPTSLNGMKYCRNLTLNNSIKLNRFNFYGFTRLANVNLENMDSLEEVDFLNMTEVGQTSNLRYIGVSACPNMTTISMNVDNPSYEITWANDSILDLQTAGGVKNIYSNCIIKGLNTILLPITIENMYFTNEYGSGYSDIVNIWSPSSATVSKTGVYPVAYHLNENNEADDYIGIDFKDLHLYNIDLGALVKIPNAINFSLYPTNTNPNFNKNRDGNTLPYLQPTGTLDLSNYTESLARFFNGVDLNRLQLVVSKTLPQTDLSYCFYNSTFDNGDRIAPILENLISVSNMDYCFYKTSVSDISILNRVNFANGTSMKYCFAYCPNIIELADVTMSSKIGDSSYMFSGSGLTTVKNVTTSSRNITGFFSYCKNLIIVENFVADGTDSYESLFQGCAMSLPPLTSIPDNIVNIKNMYRGCPNLTSINNFVFHENLVEVEGFILECEKLVNANNVTIAGAFYNDLFRGVSSLKYVNNLLISYIGRSMIFSHMFDGCTNLLEMSFHNDSYTEQVISIDYMFRGTSMKTVDFSNVSFPKVTSMKYLFADSYMKEFTFTVPNTVVNITGILSNCVNLKTLNNFNINTNVIATDWLKDTNITTLTNCSFFNKNTSFQGSTSLKTITNLTYTGQDFSNYFEDCINLQRATIIMRNSVNNMSNSFRNCPKLNFVDFTQESDLSSVGTIDGCFYGDSSLVSISNMKLTNPTTVATNITLTDCPINETEGLLINSNSALDMFRMGSNSKISKITDFNLGENADDLHDLCMDYPLLISDFVIPTNVKNVSNTFKNCTSIESVTNNWTTLYDMNKDNNLLNDVITTDCYSGCVNAKYINTDLYVDEHGLPAVLKYIPTEWGGELSFSENKTAFDIKITEENLTYSLVGNVGDAKTNWGDGTEDMNITHTYSKPGIYIISTENVKTFATGSIIDPSYSSPVVRFRQLSSSLTKGSHLFDGWTNLIKIDGISHTLDSYYYLCNNCTSLTNDIPFPPEATNVERAFYNCSNLLYATSNWEKSYNGQITTTECYKGCNAISHFDGENILAYKGDSGIDYIPSAWGGNSFTKSNSGIYEFTIPSDSYEIGFSFLISDGIVNWGDGAITKGEKTHTYSKAGTYIVKAKGWIANHSPTGGAAINANSQATLTKVLQIPYENTGTYSNSFRYGFGGCGLLTYADISNLNVNKCTRYDYLFSGCSSLNSIVFPEGFLRKSTDHYYMFSGCSSLKNIDVSKWEVANLSNLNNTFTNSGLEYIDLNNWDLKNCIGFAGTFENCSKLKTLIMPTLTPNKVKTLNGDNYMNLQSMLRGCSSLKEFDISHWEEINVDNVYRFMEGSGIETFNLSCINLKAGHLGYSMPNTPKTLVNATFYKTFSPSNLSNVNPFQNFTLTTFTQLSKESLLSFLNCLADITSSGKSYTIPLGSANLAKLSSDEIKIATDKGWSVG